MVSVRDFSIKNKLVLMQVFTAVSVLGLCFAAFVITDIQGYTERKINSTESFARVIAASSVSAIQFLDNAAAETILGDMQRMESDVVNASIYDRRGRIFASYSRDQNEPYPFSPPFENRHYKSGNFLYVYQDITDNQKNVIGTICLRVELTQLDQIIRKKFEIATLLLILGIALAFLLAYVNQRYISSPLLNLVRVIRQIRESGDYHREVDSSGKDEISMLSDEFNNLMEEVAKSHRKKDEFIGIASHELKTPLTSVKLYLESLARMKHEPLVETFITKSKEGVNKLHNLILDLLDVSKIDSGQLRLALKEVSIESLINDCIADQKMNTASHHIQRVGDTSDATVLGDKDRLEQVLINLISNAVKYSPGGTTIHINVLRDNNEVRVEVRDQGIGIEETEQKKVFGRFYRSNESNAVISGFGLGLYICSQIIKRHKGRIGVESQIGSGSTFYFILPCQGQNLEKSPA